MSSLKNSEMPSGVSEQTLIFGLEAPYDEFCGLDPKDGHFAMGTQNKVPIGNATIDHLSNHSNHQFCAEHQRCVQGKL